MANIWTQAGEELLTDIVDGTTTAPANWYVAWGTGAGTAAKGDTSMFTEAPEARVVATKSQPTTDTNRYVATITASAPRTITNVGILTQSSGGTLWIHCDFAGVALDTLDSILFTIDHNWA